MTAERPYLSSTKELFRVVAASAALEEERDYVVDSKAFLALENIKWRTEKLPDNIPDLPTLVVPNHYGRSRVQRVRLSSPETFFTTTRESFITTSIVSVEMSKISDRKTTWLMKSELSEKFLLFKSEYGHMQNVLATCYNFIPAEHEPIEVYRQIVSSLEAGFNMGAYPGIKPSKRLQPASREFEGLIAVLNIKEVNYQILPVSIFYADGEFNVTFGKIVDPKKKHPKKVVGEVMYSIGSHLPQRSRS